MQTGSGVACLERGKYEDISRDRSLLLYLQTVGIMYLSGKIATVFLALFIGIPGITVNRPERITGQTDNPLLYRRAGLHQESEKYRYMGLEKCALQCHNNREMGFQYDIIRHTSLAKAFKILASPEAIKIAEEIRSEGNPMESEICLKCHITGGGLDSSFFATSYKKEDGVTCEACHKGPYTPKSFLPVEADCLKCHNNSVHPIADFDFSERCRKIKHSRPESQPVNYPDRH